MCELLDIIESILIAIFGFKQKLRTLTYPKIANILDFPPNFQRLNFFRIKKFMDIVD